MTSFLYADVSRVPAERLSEVQYPLYLRLLLSLLIPLYLATCVGIYLQVGSRILPPLAGSAIGEWSVFSDSYCSKAEGSVPSNQDSSLGFGIALDQCKAKCRESPDCQIFTYGEWKHGLYPQLGGHFGQVRCQLYSACVVKGWEGTTLYAKHGAEFKSPSLVFPPISYIAALAPDTLALIVARSSGICFLVVLAFATAAFYNLRFATDPLLVLLVALHFVNALLLLCMQWKVSQRAEELSTKAMVVQRLLPDSNEVDSIDLTGARSSKWQSAPTPPPSATNSFGSQCSLTLDLTAFREAP